MDCTARWVILGVAMVSVNRVTLANAIVAVHAHFLPRPGEDFSVSFDRAKASCMAELSARRQAVASLNGDVYLTARKAKPNRCAWRYDIEDGAWRSDCGRLCVLDDGTPADHGMRHCCYCGAALVTNVPAASPAVHSVLRLATRDC